VHPSVALTHIKDEPVDSSAEDLDTAADGMCAESEFHSKMSTIQQKAATSSVRGKKSQRGMSRGRRQVQEVTAMFRITSFCFLYNCFGFLRYDRCQFNLAHELKEN